MGDLIDMKPWEVVEFPKWGAAIKHRASGRWDIIIFRDGQQIDVSNMIVILSDECIQIIGWR